MKPSTDEKWLREMAEKEDGCDVSVGGSVEEAILSEETIDQQAQKNYELSNRCFRPCYPWNFLRVLPREQIYKGLLHLPSKDQNKTIHEGIVLATWKPFTNAKGVKKVSEFQPGEHVLFPHFAGLPIEGYSDKHYRVVRGEDWKENEQGGIFAKVEYDDKKPREKLKKYLAFLRKRADDYPSIDDEAFLEIAANEIEKQFLLVDRDQTSVTLSGR